MGNFFFWFVIFQCEMMMVLMMMMMNIRSDMTEKEHNKTQTHMYTSQMTPCWGGGGGR